MEFTYPCVEQYVKSVERQAVSPLKRLRTEMQIKLTRGTVERFHPRMYSHDWEYELDVIRRKTENLTMISTSGISSARKVICSGRNNKH